MHRMLAIVLFFTLSLPLLAQEKFDVRANYVKHEYMIAMRDGIKLCTAVYTPRDTTTVHPILLTRTPYNVGPYGAENYPSFDGAQSSYYARHGYIIVNQDVRGRYLSEGTYVDVRPYKPNKKSKSDIDETTDTYDTVDWLVKNVKGNNGNVGIKGISYPGFYAWMGTINAHPAVKATSPQAPVSQWMGGDDWYHNGAFLLSHAFSFYSSGANFPRTGPTQRYPVRFRFPTPDGYEFYLALGAIPNANRRYLHDSVATWNDLISHGTWDSFWQERSVLPHLKNLKPATLVVGGWFDTENLYGALESYRVAEESNPRNHNSIVMGPWAHGWWANVGLDSLGGIKFGSVTTKFYTENLEAPFFEYYLNKGPDPQLPEAAVFLTGANEWKMLDSWPPRSSVSKNMYLGEEGSLSFTSPAKSQTDFDEYISDPGKPVPYTAEVRQWYNQAFMIEDQRFAAHRQDVLVYQTEPLNEELTIAGPINVHLVGSTSGTDCDWVVKVIDVFPDTIAWKAAPGRAVLPGYQMLVRGDILRGKFRKSLSKPEAFQPNQPTQIDFVLQDAFHRFKQGHRLMVQVQSSWFPMIDRNPGKFMDIYKAKDSDFQKTTQRVYRSGRTSSYLEFRTLKD